MSCDVAAGIGPVSGEESPGDSIDGESIRQAGSCRSAAVRFNVTHSEGLGLIAFSIASEVGIDVETIGRDVEMLELAAANFTTNEAAMVAAAQTEDEQARFFFRLWTRKEAVLKAAGCGIANGLKGVDVSCERLNRIGVRVRLKKPPESTGVLTILLWAKVLQLPLRRQWEIGRLCYEELVGKRRVTDTGGKSIERGGRESVKIFSCDAR